jgi:hypothetical protein
MNFLNSDFADSGNASGSIREFRKFYLSLSQNTLSLKEKQTSERRDQGTGDEHNTMTLEGKASALTTLLWNTWVLSERTAVNYQRNLLAYGVRAGMYAGESDVLFISLNAVYF